MTSRVLDLGLPNAKTKRFYSKGGCRECKRRKIKCDEAKPHCWQCLRLRKECSYPAVGEKVLRVSKRHIDGQEKDEGIKYMKTEASTDSSPNLASSASETYTLHIPQEKRQIFTQNPIPLGHIPAINVMTLNHANTHPLPPPPVMPHPYPINTYPTHPMPPPRHFVQNPSINHLLNDHDSSIPYHPPNFESNPQKNTLAPLKAGPPPISPAAPTIDDSMLQFFDQHDLNVLAADLNNIVNSIMFESNFDGKKDQDASSENSSVIYMPSPLTNSTLSASPKQPNVRNIPFDYINLTTPHERIYLEEFYDDFASIILPFNSWDPTTSKYSNPARDIILAVAANESYLLAAIIAHGARTSYKKNKLPKDEQAYCLYLSKCLEMLGPALTNDDNKSRGHLASNVEAVLLTVLILTAANASNALQNWRPHLKGAKDLLLKNSNHKNRSSKILVFCKCWFVCLEILAGISSQIGGTLNTDEELDLLFSSDEYEISVLKEYGIIFDNGFSIMFGYHYKCVDQFRDLIKLLNKRRSFQAQNPGQKYIPENSFVYLKLLSELYYQSETEFINKKCVLSPCDFPNNIVPTGNLIDYIPKLEIAISWQDTSHQAYVTAAIITVLTEFFQEPYTANQVQFLTSRIVSLIEYLGRDSNIYRHLMNCSLIMLLWPMYVAGINCTEEESKYLLTKYFLNSSQMGSGGAKFALKRIHKVWKKHTEGGETDDDDDDGKVDLVSY